MVSSLSFHQWRISFAKRYVKTCYHIESNYEKIDNSHEEDPSLTKRTVLSPSKILLLGHKLEPLS